MMESSTNSSGKNLLGFTYILLLLLCIYCCNFISFGKLFFGWGGGGDIPGLLPLVWTLIGYKHNYVAVLHSNVVSPLFLSQTLQYSLFLLCFIHGVNRGRKRNVCWQWHRGKHKFVDSGMVWTGDTHVYRLCLVAWSNTHVHVNTSKWVCPLF